MRILVHTIFYAPDLTGVAKYTSEMCEWLAGRGHHVTVIAPPPYYPGWTVPSPYSQWGYTTEQIKGVHVHRSPIWLPKKPRGLARVAYGLSFALSSIPWLIRQALHRPDVILVIEPSILNAPGAWLLARTCGSATWLHVQDFELDLALALGQLHAGKKILQRLESFLLRRFDIVSSISGAMLERAAFHGVHQDRLVHLPNWFDASIQPEPAGDLRAQFGIPDTLPIALYSGSLGAKQAIELVIDAARSTPEVRFVICGDGPQSQLLRESARDCGNISFIPLQPAAALSALLNLADIHLLPQRAGTAVSVFPSKLTGMLASGRPVVAMAERGSAVAQVISGCGVVVACEDVQAFIKGIRLLLSDTILRQRFGNNGRRRAVEQFDKLAILTALEDELLRRTGAVPRVSSPAPV